MRTQLRSVLLSVAILSTLVLQTYATVENPTPPGWDRIKRPEDYQHAVDLARFAVRRHNRETGDDLTFVRLIRGYVNGEYYKLVLTAENDGDSYKYEALVRERIPSKVRELLYFTSS